MFQILCTCCSLMVSVSAVQDSDFLRMLDHDFERNRLFLMKRMNHSSELHKDRASPILSLGQDVLVQIVGYLNHKWHFERAMLSCQDIHEACNTFLNNKFVYLLLTQCEKQKVFRTRKDIIAKIPMICRVYVDLRQHWVVMSLIRMHENGGTLVRGFDRSSGLPFLSIRLVDKVGCFRPMIRMLLLICIFDQNNLRYTLIFRRDSRHEMDPGAFWTMHLDDVLLRRSIHVRLQNEECNRLWAMEDNWYKTQICEKFRSYKDKLLRKSMHTRTWATRQC